VRSLGVEYMDVSGAGGTSWVGVETLRAQGAEKALGEEYWDWGVPTAASVIFAASAGLKCVATGGLKTGLDVAKAISLGAVAGGLAAAALRAHQQGGFEGAEQFLQGVLASLRTAFLLTGSKTAAELRKGKHFVRGELASWVQYHHGQR
jgi:isopentenyl-diphosphate delta-isomerase